MPTVGKKKFAYTIKGKKAAKRPIKNLEVKAVHLVLDDML
jgi:hypothetical protein